MSKKIISMVLGLMMLLNIFIISGTQVFASNVDTTTDTGTNIVVDTNSNVAATETPTEVLTSTEAATENSTEVLIATETPTETSTETGPSTSIEVEEEMLKNDVEYATYDASKFNFTLGGKISGNAGDTIKVPVIISNNPGFWGGSITFKYDPAFMTPVLDANNNLAINTTGSVMTEAVFLGGPVAEKSDYNVVGFTFEANGTFVNFTDNGVMATVEFVLKADLAEGRTQAIAFGDFAPIVDADGNEVSATWQSATVEIVPSATATQTPVATTTKVNSNTNNVEITTTKVNSNTNNVEITKTDSDNYGNNGSVDENENNKEGVVDVDSGESNDVNTGAATPITALVVAVGAAFVAFKSRK